MTTRLLTVNATAEALGIRASTVRSWLLRRTIASIRVGRAVRISQDEVERILTEGLRPREPQKKGGKYG